MMKLRHREAGNEPEVTQLFKANPWVKPHYLQTKTQIPDQRSPAASRHMTLQPALPARCLNSLPSVHTELSFLHHQTVPQALTPRGLGTCWVLLPWFLQTTHMPFSGICPDSGRELPIPYIPSALSSTYLLEPEPCLLYCYLPWKYTCPIT